MPTYTPINYDAFVGLLRKDPNQLVAEHSAFKADLNHAIIGICGEAGEIADAVKKFTIYNQLYDEKRIKHITEELGDIEFYIQQLRKAIGVSRGDCIRANIEKLSARYPGIVYSNAMAASRLDKAAEQQQTGEPTL